MNNKKNLSLTIIFLMILMNSLVVEAMPKAGSTILLNKNSTDMNSSLLVSREQNTKLCVLTHKSKEYIIPASAPYIDGACSGESNPADIIAIIELTPEKDKIPNLSDVCQLKNNENLKFRMVIQKTPFLDDRGDEHLGLKTQLVQLNDDKRLDIEKLNDFYVFSEEELEECEEKLGDVRICFFEHGGRSNGQTLVKFPWIYDNPSIKKVNENRELSHNNGCFIQGPVLGRLKQKIMAEETAVIWSVMEAVKDKSTPVLTCHVLVNKKTSDVIKDKFIGGEEDKTLKQLMDFAKEHDAQKDIWEGLNAFLDCELEDPDAEVLKVCTKVIKEFKTRGKSPCTEEQLREFITSPSMNDLGIDYLDEAKQFLKDPQDKENFERLGMLLEFSLKGMEPIGVHYGDFRLEKFKHANLLMYQKTINGHDYTQPTFQPAKLGVDIVSTFNYHSVPIAPYIDIYTSDPSMAFPLVSEFNYNKYAAALPEQVRSEMKKCDGEKNLFLVVQGAAGSNLVECNEYERLGYPLSCDDTNNRILKLEVRPHFWLHYITKYGNKGNPYSNGNGIGLEQDIVKDVSMEGVKVKVFDTDNGFLNKYDNGNIVIHNNESNPFTFNARFHNVGTEKGLKISPDGPIIQKVAKFHENLIFWTVVSYECNSKKYMAATLHVLLNNKYQEENKNNDDLLKAKKYFKDKRLMSKRIKELANGILVVKDNIRKVNFRYAAILKNNGKKGQNGIIKFLKEADEALEVINVQMRKITNRSMMDNSELKTVLRDFKAYGEEHQEDQEKLDSLKGRLKDAKSKDFGSSGLMDGIVKIALEELKGEVGKIQVDAQAVLIDYNSSVPGERFKKDFGNIDAAIKGINQVFKVDIGIDKIQICHLNVNDVVDKTIEKIKNLAKLVDKVDQPGRALKAIDCFEKEELTIRDIVEAIESFDGTGECTFHNMLNFLNHRFPAGFSIQGKEEDRKKTSCILENLNRFK